jgi:hypothetical protein
VQQKTRQEANKSDSRGELKTRQPKAVSGTESSVLLEANAH